MRPRLFIFLCLTGVAAAFSPSDYQTFVDAIGSCIVLNATGEACPTEYGPMRDWDTSRVTDMSWIFHNLKYFNQDISSWDVAKVTSLYRTFSYLNVFNGDVSAWDVAKVTSMRSVFYYANEFNGDLQSWDTSKVTSLAYAFRGNTKFNSDLSSFDTSRVVDFTDMFSRSYAFNSDISSWDTSRATTLEGIFFQANVFNGDISMWDVSKVETIRDILHNSFAFDNDISLANWDTSRVIDMQGSFLSTPYNADISSWDTSKVTVFELMFASSLFNRPLASWDVSSVTNMQASEFNQPLDSWDTSSLVDATNLFWFGMFFFATSFNQDLSSWDTSSVLDMNDMFTLSATTDASYQALSQWDFSNVVSPKFEMEVSGQLSDISLQTSIFASAFEYYPLVLDDYDDLQGVGRVIISVASDAPDEVVLPSSWFDRRFINCDLNGNPSNVFRCQTNPGAIESACGVSCSEYNCTTVSTAKLAEQGYTVTNSFPEGLAFPRVALDGSTVATTFFEAASKPSDLGLVLCSAGYGAQNGAGHVGVACRGVGFEFEPYGCSPCAAGKYSAAPAAQPCATCGAGMFSASQGSSTCDECPAGSFQNEQGQTDCKTAPAGSFVSGRAAEEAAECPKGTFQPADGGAACLECLPGTYQSTTGQTACVNATAGYHALVTRAVSQWSCEIGEYTDGPGRQYCSQCKTEFGPTYTTARINATTCDACVDLYYMDVEGTCQPCDEGAGMDCEASGPTVDTLVVHPGHWRSAATSGLVHECTSGCMGGNATGNKSCAEGHTGPLCAVCESGHHLIGLTGECQSCQNPGPFLAQSAVVVGVLVAAAVSVVKQHRKASRGVSARVRQQAEFHISSSFVPKLKIMIPLFQVLGSLGWVYGVKDLFMAPGLDDVLVWMEVFGFDMANAVPLGCIAEQTALSSLLATSLPPILIAALVGVAAGASRLLWQDAERPGWAARFEGAGVSGVVFYWLIATPTVAVKVFRTLRTCHNFSELGASFMHVDYGTDCSTEQYDMTRGVAMFMLFVYPVGVPVAILVALCRRRRRISAHQEGQTIVNRIATLVVDVRSALKGKDVDNDARRRLAKQSSAVLHEAREWYSRTQDLEDEMFSKSSSQPQNGPEEFLGEAVGHAIVRGLKVDKNSRGYRLRDVLSEQMAVLIEAHVGLRLVMETVMGGNGTSSGERGEGDLHELFAFYRVWWWEAYDAVRKLLLVGLVVIIVDEEKERILIAVAVEIVSLNLTSALRPYQDPADNLLAEACRAVTIVIMLHALALSTGIIVRDSTTDGDSGTESSDDADVALVAIALTALISIAVFAFARSGLWYMLRPDLLLRKTGLIVDDKEAAKHSAPKEPDFVVSAIEEDGENFVRRLSLSSMALDSIPAGGKASSPDDSGRPILGKSVELLPWEASGTTLNSSGGHNDDLEGGRGALISSSPSSDDDPLGVFVDWIVKAAEAAGHYHDTSRHNLRLLLGTQAFTLGMSDATFENLKVRVIEQIAAIGKPLDDEYQSLGLGGVAGSSTVRYTHRELEETVKEGDGAGERRVAQDNVGAVATPQDWDWEADGGAAERAWIHVLCLIGLGIDEAFQRRVEKCCDDVFGDRFDGFSPAPIKTYGRIKAKIGSGDDYANNAAPRPNMCKDVVRCLVQVPTAQDVAPMVAQVEKMFGGGLVRVKNPYDIDSEGAVEFHHLRIVNALVLFHPTLDELSSSITAKSQTSGFSSKQRLTFGDMAANAHVQGKWSEYAGKRAWKEGEPQARRKVDVQKAIDYLRGGNMADEAVGMICEVQIVTRSVGEARHEMHELYKIGRAESKSALFADFNERPPPLPATLLEAAAQGEFDIVEHQLAKKGAWTTHEAMQALDAARAAGHVESVAMLEAAVDPAAIANSLKSKFRELKKKMFAIPPKDERSAAERDEYRALKREALAIKQELATMSHA